MSNDKYEKKNQFRQPLFDFYMDRRSDLENFKGLNRLLGGLGVILGLAGGSTGVGFVIGAAGVSIYNEVRLAKLTNKFHHDHQAIISSVYESQK